MLDLDRQLLSDALSGEYARKNRELIITPDGYLGLKKTGNNTPEIIGRHRASTPETPVSVDASIVKAWARHPHCKSKWPDSTATLTGNGLIISSPTHRYYYHLQETRLDHDWRQHELDSLIAEYEEQHEEEEEETAEEEKEELEPSTPETPESDPERTTESTKDDPGQTPDPPASSTYPGALTADDYSELSPEEQLERATAGVLTGEPEGRS